MHHNTLSNVFRGLRNGNIARDLMKHVMCIFPREVFDWLLEKTKIQDSKIRYQLSGCIQITPSLFGPRYSPITSLDFRAIKDVSFSIITRTVRINPVECFKRELGTDKRRLSFRASSKGSSKGTLFDSRIRVCPETLVVCLLSAWLRT